MIFLGLVLAATDETKTAIGNGFGAAGAVLLFVVVPILAIVRKRKRGPIGQWKPLTFVAIGCAALGFGGMGIAASLVPPQEATVTADATTGPEATAPPVTLSRSDREINHWDDAGNYERLSDFHDEFSQALRDHSNVDAYVACKQMRADVPSLALKVIGVPSTISDPFKTMVANVIDRYQEGIDLCIRAFNDDASFNPAIHAFNAGNTALELVRVRVNEAIDAANAAD